MSDALGASPTDARLYVARGSIYAALNQFSKAIADLTAAEKLNPGVDTADPYAPATNAVRFLLAVAHWQAGHRKEAIDYFSQVIADNPMHAKSLYYRGLVYWKSGDKARAVADIESQRELARSKFTRRPWRK